MTGLRGEAHTAVQLSTGQASHPVLPHRAACIPPRLRTSHCCSSDTYQVAVRGHRDALPRARGPTRVAPLLVQSGRVIPIKPQRCLPPHPASCAPNPRRPRWTELTPRHATPRLLGESWDWDTRSKGAPRWRLTLPIETALLLEVAGRGTGY